MMKKLILFLSIQTLASFAWAVNTMNVSLSCENKTYSIEVTPQESDKARVEIYMINKKTGAIVDDNSYSIVPSKGSLVHLSDAESRVDIMIRGTQSENIGQLKVIYKNGFKGLKENFQSCDIMD